MSAGNGKVSKNLGSRNLRKGNIAAPTIRQAENSDSAKPAKLPPGQGQGNIDPMANPKGNVESIIAARKRDKDLGEIARIDPERAQEELYSDLTVAVGRQLRKLNRAGGEPSRLLIEAVKELRQAGLVVLEIRRSRGSLAEAEDFFGEVGSRVEALNAVGAMEGVFPMTQQEPNE